jgi:hypothetical protein
VIDANRKGSRVSHGKPSGLSCRMAELAARADGLVIMAALSKKHR